MGAFLVVIIAIGWSHHVFPRSADRWLSGSYTALLSLFLWATVWVILRALFHAEARGGEKVLGAICGYPIAGDAWGSINTLTYLLLPATYSLSPPVAVLIGDWHGRQALFSYYSFTQMLTIGYADVTPLRAPATTLSLFGALFGLFYTAVVVAQFVSVAQSGTRDA